MGKLVIIDCGLSVLSFSIHTIINSSFLCVCHKYLSELSHSNINNDYYFCCMTG